MTIQFFKPHILLAAIIGVTSCTHKQVETTSSTLASARTTAYLEACELNGLNGHALIVQGDSIILSTGFGYADKENSIAPTVNTVFDICSVSKQFTAAAILKLVEQEALNVTDSIGSYFNDVPFDKQNITIHHLLTHSAGFGHDIGDSDFDHIPTSEYFKLLFDSELLFTPGEKYEYSNCGYSVLGRIIEIASGQSYEGYLREHLFLPAGMLQTGYLLPTWDSTMVAKEYAFNVLNRGSNNSNYQQDQKIAWPLKANGGINSTQEDMYKWYLALKNNTVLNKSSIEKLTRPYILEYEGESSYYGYGWAIMQSNRDTKVITHNGYNGLSYYEIMWFPEEDAIILFATNSASQESIGVPGQLEKLLFEIDYKAEPIAKNKLSKILMFIENYQGDVNLLGEELKQAFATLLDEPSSLNRICGVYMRNGQLDKATLIAELNTQLFPSDGNIWDTMGDVYMLASQTENAIASYKRALELRPIDADCFWCSNSSSQLKEMGVEE
jgi:CubicO group peptidase (beta-lactamase class C family)